MKDNLYATDIALFALWDSNSMEFINTQDLYFKHFVEDKDMLEQMNKGAAVIWGTKLDGVFKILVKVNEMISDEEKSMVHKEVHGLKFVVSGDKVIYGSPEWVGFKEKKGLEKEEVQFIEGLEKGSYSVDIYCLLRIDEGRKFLDYLVVLTKVDENHVFEVIESLPYLTYTAG
jgi:hypothetical protein